MYRFGKRVGDIVLSGLGLVVLSPLLLVLGIIVKCSSPGPVLFKQQRVGLHKKLFTMLKYRSMRTDAPAETPTHLLKDPSTFITRSGRVMRNTSLDELPQLWNILIGDMSIVGPRPALWNQDDLIAERDKYGANDIKPGLTGLAQIRGRDRLTAEQKSAFDGEYRENMSFALDCRIIAKTVVVVLKGKDIGEGLEW